MSEISSHSCQNAKINKRVDSSAGKAVGKEGPHSLVVGVQTVAATLESSAETSREN